MFALPVCVLPMVLAVDPLPTVEVKGDNTVITMSCRVVIPEHLVIDDTDRNGVIHIQADEAGSADPLVIEFAPGSVLRGAAPDAPDDTLEGFGIRIVGRRNVTIRGAALEGFRAGVYATRADGLTIEGARITRNRRQHLRSTPQAEDQSDWLWPHKNDGREWLNNYGAAVYVEDSKDVVLRGITVRNSQNGLVIDRVSGAKVYDNDCSFLSGWGLAMWRSSRNLISRNAFDFCVRGYSHGVYNRGQDSAGILCFEQCCENVFVENSATHGGDGFFGFAGREALGEPGAGTPGLDHAGLGDNGNIFARNDLSYSAAHGLELTFSFDNWVIDNRLVGNNICGIWGGYSQRMHIRGNEIADNGSKGAREGGGVNSEHAHAIDLVGNRFRGNSTGVAIWCDENAGLMKLPWAAANHKGCGDNVLISNTFEGEPEDWRLSNAGMLRVVDQAIDAAKSSTKGATTVEVLDAAPELSAPPPLPEAIGETRPVGARDALRGRETIVMGEWGPWDHQTPMLRPGGRAAEGVEFQVFGARELGAQVLSTLEGHASGRIRAETLAGPTDVFRTVSIRATDPGVTPYAVRISMGSASRVVRGTIVRAEWNARFFSWDAGADPRNNLEGWRGLARSDRAVAVPLKDLDLPYGHGGPGDLPALKAYKDKLPGRDHFGMVAHTTLNLPKGTWRFSTLSDDGVRVSVNGRSVVENWTWHAPTHDHGLFEQSEEGPIDIVVEHFEIDGFATLSLNIEPEETTR